MLENQEQIKKLDRVMSKMETKHNVTDTSSEEVYEIESAIEFLKESGLIVIIFS